MIRTLTADDFESLHAAFIAAFSDYVVPLNVTREQLAERNTRRGWVPELSVGAFDGDRMVAFTINCVDGDRAYDNGTGVIPTHRRTGLGRGVMEKSIEVLRERCGEYVLEVVADNTRAFELYRSLGFEVVRGFQCWSFESHSLTVSESHSVAHPEWRDVEPSWQNSDSSIARSKAERIILGDDRGYAVVFLENGDVAQLAVNPKARRQGVGTQLLHAAAHVAGRPLRIMNIDERDAGIAAFLEHVGAKRTVRQLEMSLRLR